MSDIVIVAPLIVALPVAWTGVESPVRRVSCIGRNSAVHLVEIGHEPDGEPPTVLPKNPNDVDTYGQSPSRPRFKDVHHSTKLRNGCRVRETNRACCA